MGQEKGASEACLFCLLRQGRQRAASSWRAESESRTIWHGRRWPVGEPAPAGVVVGSCCATRRRARLEAAWRIDKLSSSVRFSFFFSGMDTRLRVELGLAGHPLATARSCTVSHVFPSIFSILLLKHWPCCLDTLIGLELELVSTLALALN